VISRAVKLEELEEVYYECLHRNLRYKLGDLEDVILALTVARIMMANKDEKAVKYINRSLAYLDHILKNDLLKDDIRRYVNQVKEEIEEAVKDGYTTLHRLGDLIVRMRHELVRLTFKCMLEEL
jgi:CRISPR/Cas system CSM-associated protein Csm2 small subunit